MPTAARGEEAMSMREHVIQELKGLSDADLAQVAEFLAFLRFRARRHATPSLDETQLAALYAEFAEEDHALAEEGMSDYAAGLRKEDVE
jgi:DNA-binding GntR family transcriptional regulator